MSAIGVILVYDITSRNSFDNLKEWMEQIKINSSKNSLIVLIGNKVDLE